MIKKSGFTLIEILASLAITSIILLVLGSIILSTGFINRNTLNDNKIQNKYIKVIEDLDKNLSYGNSIFIVNNKNPFSSELNENINLILEIKKSKGKADYIGYFMDNGSKVYAQFNDCTLTANNTTQVLDIVYSNYNIISDIIESFSIENINNSYIDNIELKFKEYDKVFNIPFSTNTTNQKIVSITK